MALNPAGFRNDWKPGVFLIPNPWDAGSTRILAALGFEAFTTLSAAADVLGGVMVS
jgi:2-methylisocitrate lyase-like PEP mutase family enzyme